MKIELSEPPRIFSVGKRESIQIKDCGSVQLGIDEQVTFMLRTNVGFDVTRKSWGFYALPALNGRLLTIGLRTCIIKNRMGRYYILLVEGGCETEFQKYLLAEDLAIICWLDSDEALARLELSIANCIVVEDPSSRRKMGT